MDDGHLKRIFSYQASVGEKKEALRHVSPNHRILKWGISSPKTAALFYDELEPIFAASGSSVEWACIELHNKKDEVIQLLLLKLIEAHLETGKKPALTPIIDGLLSVRGQKPISLSIICWNLIRTRYPATFKSNFSVSRMPCINQDLLFRRLLVILWTVESSLKRFGLRSGVRIGI